MTCANPLDVASRTELAQQVLQVPSHIRAAIAKAAIDSQKVQDYVEYYSAIRLAPTVAAGAAPTDRVTYAYQAGQKVTAFSYGSKTGAGSAASAGFQSSYEPGTSDTNIATSGKTMSGETLSVFGLSLVVLPGTDFDLLRLLDQNADVSIVRGGGGDGGVLCPLAMVPRVQPRDGIYAAGLRRPAFDRESLVIPAAATALPDAAVFRPTLGTTWAATGPDELMHVEVTLRRACLVQSDHPRIDPGDGAWDDVPLAAPWAPNPDADVRLLVVIHAMMERARSRTR